MFDEVYAQKLIDRCRYMAAISVSRGWPVRFDHCFLRIILDSIFRGCWYDYLAPFYEGKIATHQLTKDQVDYGLSLAERIINGDDELLYELNRESKRYRLERLKPGEKGRLFKSHCGIKPPTEVGTVLEDYGSTVLFKLGDRVDLIPKSKIFRVKQ